MVDWFHGEDIILYLKRNQVALASQIQNAMNGIEETIEQKYPALVREEEQQTLTNVPYQYRIETVPNAIPFVGHDYRRSVLENKAITEEVEKMLKKGVIKPRKSDWCSPVVLIKKPDGSCRFCIDYRGLNKLTIKDKYPIPRILELLDQLQGSHYFSTIDLKSGYWQLPLAEEDQKKTAFTANGRLYEFTCLPFGVANGPSNFMRFMHTVLKGLPRCMVYLDDVILHSRSKEEHLEDLHRVLEQRLQSCNLKISMKKCQFFKHEVKFLEFLVSGNGIRSNPENTKVIKTWPVPTGTKALMRFLGFCVFYHKFIKDLSITAKPLYNLLKKDVSFRWTEQAQKAFDTLKQQVMDMPTLAHPNPDLAFDLHCDASNVGLGAALVQVGRPVGFASRTLTAAETNYHTTEKECLAVRWALDHFHPLVHGARLTIYTDHAALKSILSTKKTPKGRIARWIMELLLYTFDLIHKRGILNTDADALSRLAQQNSQDPAALNVTDFKQLQLADPEIKALLRGGWRNPLSGETSS